MSTAVVTGFSSKVQQENRIKSRKSSKQSGLRPSNRQTENLGTSKKYTAAPLQTPRKALSELSSNISSTPWQSDMKHQMHTCTPVLQPVNTKRQNTSTLGKTHKVPKTSSDDFPDIETLPRPLAIDLEPHFVPPPYFNELSVALKHTSYIPPTLYNLPQPPVLSLSIPRRPLPTSNDLEFVPVPDDDLGSTGTQSSTLALPEIPDFDF